MAFYTNHSRRTAIVTLNIQSTDNPDKALKKGEKGVYADLSLDVGYHDILVEPGEALALGDNTTATLFGVRAAD